MEKDALLKASEDASAGWETLIEALGIEGLEHPGALGTWRVRDILAHCNGYDRWQLVQLRCAFTGDNPTDAELTGGIEYPPNDDMRDDAMNAMFVAGANSLTTQEVLRHWREVANMRARWISGASQEQLDAVVGADWNSDTKRIIRLASEVPSVDGPLPAWQILFKQVEHLDEHLAAVREWMSHSPNPI